MKAIRSAAGAVTAIVAVCIAALPGASGAAETPKRGGTLTYMIPADAPPSLDGHRESTFATVHSTAPF
jgi:peptide/nickel transport system substrate-binding protein